MGTTSTLLFKELRTKEEILAGFSVMKHLRTHLDENSYLELVLEAQQKEGYRLVALYDHGKMVAITGFMPMITLYNGRFIWVCDLVTAPSERSKGYGEKLLSYVHQWAEENGYGIVSLSSGLQRVDAHRFYEEKMQYDKVSYVFLKRLSE
ncbi:GNAT family N-acetyltransferase [Parageobacillus thermoglucosidasius]|uniref:GNAT family N-acetyltransferase n=1 Tax=Parageobacillus thermoglucosidasius TaxID=1426 RepID=A0AB38R0C0_PARTM|nr:GNAT family N-acetyltransferase [Parageobacillus thermoglucosidasius]AEH49256.1 GCN5-related N-acetyltransferase [Parageobacillus thermoglucosidasius C56-YS93]MED4906249.1 GNAT family N-acetyltransferase [Parageobacillus thermoglucosidasius]MED4915470.1 GNAT family N-acetyltransferase [Parageobacillus thermoglucosidasius]MED4945854.1 GNAT family N-acetyltransferase [Parageobacillus thermoglucosidasius]MED4984333.1 GNAT family N-acetyltransferase [Parageobacillus thermoglucosidasius]